MEEESNALQRVYPQYPFAVARAGHRRFRKGGLFGSDWSIYHPTRVPRSNDAPKRAYASGARSEGEGPGEPFDFEPVGSRVHAGPQDWFYNQSEIEVVLQGGAGVWEKVAKGSPEALIAVLGNVLWERVCPDCRGDGMMPPVSAGFRPPRPCGRCVGSGLCGLYVKVSD